MAIYHLHTKNISRSKGQSALASAAYRRAARLYDEYNDKVFDYTKKKDVAHSELLIPENAPDWIKEIVELHETDKTQAAEQLWNHVELSEKRKDARLAREVEFALPVELNQAQCILLARDFVNDQFVKRGMVADMNMHWNEKNPHVHVMLTTRTLSHDGFGAKVRDWNSKEVLKSWRAQWAEYANFHLAMEKLDVRIDHRSYEAQGIDLIPTLHEGKVVREMHAKGLESERMADVLAIKAKNREKIHKTPEALLDKVSKERHDFSENNVTEIMQRYHDDAGMQHATSPETGAPSLGVLALSANQFPPDGELLETPCAGITDISPIANSASLEKENQENTEKTLSQVVDKLEAHHAAFTEQDIAKALDNTTESLPATKKETEAGAQTNSNQSDNIISFTNTLAKIKGSPEFIHLGTGDDGRERYTTQTLFNLENDLQTLGDNLSVKHNHVVKNAVIDKAIRHSTLDETQADAVRYLLEGADVTALVGHAGTGKSYALKTAKIAWEQSGFNLYGVALSSIAAGGLEKSAGIESRTIESFLYRHKQGSIALGKQSIVVMDEAGMTDSRSMVALLKIVKKANAKLVLVGDPQQLQAIGAGAPFRALMERIGFIEMSNIRRQEVDWQREVTRLLATGDVTSALALYEENNCIELHHKTPLDAMHSLIATWQKERLEATSDLSESLILAYRNTDVDTLNQLARGARLNASEIESGFAVNTSKGKIEVSVGERLLFLQNAYKQGLRNGQQGTVIGMERDNQNQVTSITVSLDGKTEQNHQKKGKDTPLSVTINPQDYNQFTYGYATTVHKAQGMTVDRSYLLASGGWVRNLVYVALSRHRQSAKLFADTTSFKDFLAMQRQMHQLRIKDSVLDYPLAFAARRGIDNSSMAQRIKTHLTTRLKTMVEKVEAQVEQSLRPQRYWAKQMAALAFELKEQRYEDKVQQRRADARLVYQYSLANQTVGKAWSELSNTMSKFGISLNEALKEKEGAGLQLVKSHPLYHNAQQAIRERNQIAHRIESNYARYQTTIENFYQIPRENLISQAQSHEGFNHVNAYLEYSGRPSQQDSSTKRQSIVPLGNEKPVLRDRMAALIVNDLKTHAPALTQLKVEHKILWRDAHAHHRRELLSQLNQEERQCVYLVDRYVKQSKKSQKLWSLITGDEKIQHPITHPLLPQAKGSNLTRDRLALTIDNDFDRYQIGLALHRIGTLETAGLSEECKDNKHDSPNNIKESILAQLASTTDKQKEFAEKRLERFKKQAQAARCYQRVENYQKALENNDAARFALANIIRQDTKAHHPAVMMLSDSPKTLWRTVRNNAKQFARDNLYKQLTPDHQVALEEVETYIQKRRAVGASWAEINALKAAGQTVKPEVQEITISYTHLRNELAAKIKAEPHHYHAALAFYDIKQEDLDKHTYAHACRERAMQFKQKRGSIQERLALAQTITADYKAHFAAIKAFEVDIKQLNRFSRLADRLETLSSLTPNERAYYKTMTEYQRLRREAGSLWAAIFKAKEQKQEIPQETYQKAQSINARRDYLAARLIKQSDEYPDLLRHGRVKIVDYMRHAEKHAARVHEVERYHQQRLQAIHTFNKLHRSEDITQLADKKPEAYLNWRRQWSGVMIEATRIFDREAAAFQGVLQDKSLSAEQYEQDRELTKKLDKVIAHQCGQQITRARTAFNKETNAQDFYTGVPSPLQIPPAYQQKSPSKKRWDFDLLNRTLTNETETLVTSLLGDPTQQSPREYRYGKKGSLWIGLQGARRGSWYDHEAGQGGNLLKLIQHVQSCDFKAALDYAGKYLHLTPEAFSDSGHIQPEIQSISSYQQPINSSPDNKNKTPLTKEELKRINRVKKIVRESLPIEGTLAERYLREHRGIRQPKLPESLRFHPGVYEPETKKELPVMVAIAKTIDNESPAIQVTYLDEKTANKANVEVKKRSFGTVKRAAVLLQKGESNGSAEKTIAMAEGVETALSIIMADKTKDVYTTLGVSNMGSFGTTLKEKNILICADNDGQDAASNKTLENAVNRLVNEGKNVKIAQPEMAKTETGKKDFNDVLKTSGTTAIKAYLDNPILDKTAFEPDKAIDEVVEQFEHEASIAGPLIITKDRPLAAETPLMEPLEHYDYANEFDMQSQLSEGSVMLSEYDQLALSELTDDTKHQPAITEDKVVSGKVNEHEKEATVIQEEWMKLRGIDNPTVKLMVDYHEYLEKTKAGAEYDDFKQELDKLTIKTMDNKRLVEQIKTLAPTLSEQFMDTLKNSKSVNKITMDYSVYKFNENAHQSEWEKLRQVKDDTVQMMIQYHDIFKKEKDPKEIKDLNKYFYPLVEKVADNKPLMVAVKSVAPSLSQAFNKAAATLGKIKSQSMDREYLP